MAHAYCARGNHFPEFTIAISDEENDILFDNKGNPKGWTDGTRGLTEEVRHAAEAEETVNCYSLECPGFLEECDWNHTISDAEAEARKEPVLEKS